MASKKPNVKIEKPGDLFKAFQSKKQKSAKLDKEMAFKKSERIMTGKPMQKKGKRKKKSVRVMQGKVMQKKAKKGTEKLADIDQHVMKRSKKKKSAMKDCSMQKSSKKK